MNSDSFGPLFSSELLAKAKPIKLFIMDVDGVLSDGKVYYSETGDEQKNFNIKDGLGIKLLHQSGIKTAIITGRKSLIVKKRADELGIPYIYQGCSDKRAAFMEMINKEQLSAQQIAHIGDDLPDLPLMKTSGLGIAVNDAHWFVQQHADWVTTSIGGGGAVREAAELFLVSQNKLDEIHQQYLTL